MSGRRGCSVLIPLQQETRWISKGNLCNVFLHCSQYSIMFYASKRSVRREGKKTPFNWQWNDNKTTNGEAAGAKPQLLWADPSVTIMSGRHGHIIRVVRTKRVMLGGRKGSGVDLGIGYTPFRAVPGPGHVQQGRHRDRGQKDPWHDRAGSAQLPSSQLSGITWARFGMGQMRWSSAYKRSARCGI